MRINSIQFKYILIHVIFWCGYVVTWSYTAVYLEHYGYNNSVVGLVTGLGAVISVLLQPMLATAVKRYSGLTTRKIIIFLKLLAIIIAFSMWVEPAGRWTIAVLFLLLATIDVAVPSMLSTLAMEYVNSGKEINYGVARGTGSVAYAAFSVLIGYMLRSVGIKWLIFIYAILSLGVILFCVCIGEPILQEAKVDTDEADKQKQIGIIRKYPFLVYFLIGTVVLFMGHNMINMFLVRIIEKAGGTSENLGVALAIAAMLELPIMSFFGRLVKKVSINKLLLFSAVCFLAKCMLTYFATNLGMIYMAQILQIGAFGLFTPASVYFINISMKQEDSGIGQALLGAFSLGLGGALGNVLGGFVIENIDVSGMLVCTVLLAAMGVFFIYAGNKKFRNCSVQK